MMNKVKVYLKIPVAKLMIILVIQLVVIQWTNVNPEETSNERIYIVSGKFINKINFFLDEYLRQVEEEWKEVEEKKIKINKEKNTLAENQKNENELINLEKKVIEEESTAKNIENVKNGNIDDKEDNGLEKKDNSGEIGNGNSDYSVKGNIEESDQNNNIKLPKDGEMKLDNEKELNDDNGNEDDEKDLYEDEKEDNDCDKGNLIKKKN